MARDTSLVLTSSTLQTPFAEAYRALRANINFTAIGQGVRTVLVTSGKSGEGKSTTVANLAILLAQAGQRVILVDADFRRPRLRQLFSTNGNGHGPQMAPLGLTELIAGTATFVEVATPVEGFGNLHLVGTGAIPPNPSELLNSPQMRSVMADLCGRADVVLLDTPPCSLYADAVELTKIADGVLYVLKSGPQGLVNHVRVLKQLQQGKARLIGIVMNQVEAGAAGYGPYPGGGASRG